VATATIKKGHRTLDDKKSLEASSLVAVWEQHLAAEFDSKDADAALDTMTAEPEVIHVPICGGASGREALRPQAELSKCHTLRS